VLRCSPGRAAATIGPTSKTLSDNSHLGTPSASDVSYSASWHRPNVRRISTRLKWSPIYLGVHGRRFDANKG
jgi:hypothetical protein